MSKPRYKLQIKSAFGVRVTLRSRAETPQLARIDFDQQIAARFKYPFKTGPIEAF